MEQKICKSCGMPLTASKEFGTNADGSRNDDYCQHCYKSGAFTAECSMEELLRFCAEVSAAPDALTPEAAKNRLRHLFYNLKPKAAGKTIEEKAAELLAWCNAVTLASVNAEGFPRPVVLAKIASRGYNEVWMATDSDSVKVRDFRRNAKAGLCFSDDADSVTLTGEVEVISDDAARRKMWQEWLVGFFPGGPTDPHYTLLRFIGRQATMWIDREFVHKDSIGCDH